MTNKEFIAELAQRTGYSPEVDPEVLIPVSEGQLTIGAFYDVEMTDAEAFDLYGTVIK